MSRPILLHEARLLPLLDAGGTPITGTAPDKLVGRFISKRLQHTFGGSSWDVTLEGSIDGVNFVDVPGAVNLTGDGIVEIPDFWQAFRLVSNVVDTLVTFSAVLGGLEADEIISVANLGGSSGGGGAVLGTQDFGGFMNLVGNNYVKGIGAATNSTTTDISQLTAWIVPVELTLKHIEITSFRSSFTTDPVVGIFIGTSGTPAVSVTMSTVTTLPDTGSYQVLSLGDTVIPVGSVLTVRQTGGQTLEFSAATVYYV